MLGPLTAELVDARCPAPQRKDIRELLSTQCAERLPLVDSTPEWLALIDRVQLSTLRGSSWDFARISAKVAQANVDWRDSLLRAGFGSSLAAHRAWQAHALLSGDIS